MAEQKEPLSNQLQFFLADLGTRIKDLEEKTSAIKEKINLVSQNLIDIRQESEEKFLKLDKQTVKLSSALEKINSLLQSVLSETNSFVKKEEIVLIERMLRDFQPIEFVRKKDVQEMLAKKTLQNIEEKTKQSANQKK